MAVTVIDTGGANFGRSDVIIVACFVGAWHLGILIFRCFFSAASGGAGAGAGEGIFGVLEVIACLASRLIFGLLNFCLVCSSYFNLPYFWSFNCLTSFLWANQQRSLLSFSDLS